MAGSGTIQSCICILQNKTKRLQRSIRQYGGTAQMSKGDAVTRECAQGNDKRGLGRWVWQLYRGINNKQVQVVTAY